MRRLEAGGGDEPSMIKVHALFHRALYKDQGNALLLSLIEIFATIQRSMTLANRYRTRDMKQFIELHATLVDAIERGSAAEVRTKLLEHFEEALEWSQQAMASEGRSQAGG